MLYLLSLLLLTSLFTPLDSFAEPWLANRYAQNCAGCHAPGRVNRPAIKRRCTLSCQGCHVNPNGGGLRNYYGKYNQNKWLHSFDSKVWKQGTPPPAPYGKQPYNHKVVDRYLSKASPAAKRRMAGKLFREGTPTRYLNAEEEVPLELYDKHHAAEEFTMEHSDARYIMRIPRDDPYRERRETLVTAGADFRYFILNHDDPISKENKTYTFPMGVDFGLRYMPVDKVALVTETRFLNAPTGSAWDDGFRDGQIRSAYLLVDDLMYNSFAMYGLYRPMFGHYSPDHTSLFASMTGLDQRTVLHGLTLGTAPNVPFVNVHLFTPTSSGGTISGEQGYAINLGTRFVTMGLSFMFSYWSTTDETGPSDLNKTMMSLNAGGTYDRLVANFDMTTIEKDTVGQTLNKGAVTTTELKYRFWREMYLQANYAIANTTPQLLEGSSTQMSYGVKTFLLAGTELEFLAGTQTVDAPEQDTSHSDYYLLQFHLFF